MTAPAKRRWSYSLRTLFVVVGVAVLFGTLFLMVYCGPEKARIAKQAQAIVEANAAGFSVTKSADCLLGPDDYQYFTPGRSKTEILNDIQWRGNFEFAAYCDGKEVAAISYGLFGGPMSSNGLSVLAIFIDEKFVKFVLWPSGDAQIELGDFGILKRAIASEPASIADLEKEHGTSFAQFKGLDPGLAATWLRFGGDIEASRAPMLRTNSELRDQFNAARLRIGMGPTEVQSAFRALPLESGATGSYDFQIYGSTISLDITSDLHYSNVLVVLKNGKTVGLYSGGLVPGGDGLERMRRWFVDLAAQHGPKD